MNVQRHCSSETLPLTTEAVVASAGSSDAEAVAAERNVSALSYPTVLEREVLFAEFAPLVRRLIRQYGRHFEMRQDLTGEIYCRFCALLDQYDPKRGVPLRPYLVRQLSSSVYTYARNQWKVQKREVELNSSFPAQPGAHAYDPTPVWMASLVKEELAANLPNALVLLPERQRRVVVWRYYEDRSFEEIASLLHIQPATARSLLRHGLNNLRKIMPRTE